MLCLCALAVPFAVVAQEQAVPPAEEELFFADSNSEAVVPSDGELTAFGFSDLIRMVVVLVAVVGAIYGAVALIKRFNRGAVEESSAIRVLASKTIAGGKSVHAVQVGQKVYLLGAGDATIGLIAEVSDRESVDELQLAHSAAEAPAGASQGGFGAKLAAVFGGSAGDGSGGLEFLQRQRERLRGLR